MLDKLLAPVLSSTSVAPISLPSLSVPSISVAPVSVAPVRLEGDQEDTFNSLCSEQDDDECYFEANRYGDEEFVVQEEDYGENSKMKKIKSRSFVNKCSKNVYKSLSSQNNFFSCFPIFWFFFEIFSKFFLFGRRNHFFLMKFKI